MLFKLSFVILCSVAVFATDESLRSWGGGGPRSFYCSTNPNPCLYGGVCVDAKSKPSLGDWYECDCDNSRCRGTHCETCPPIPTPVPQGPCNPNPCKGDCQCQPSCKHSDGYYCRSAAGYLGKDCTIPPPQLECHSNRIVVKVDKTFVEEFDLGLRNSFLSVQTGASVEVTDFATCRKQMNQVVGRSYEFTFQMPFSQCGFVSSQNADGSVSFKNQIWFNRDLANKLFDVPIPTIAFECQYTREYQLITTLQPIVPTPPTIRDEFFVKPTISLCKSQACPSSCPANLQVNPGAIYTVGENIHVTMSLDTGSHVTTVDKMCISCNPDTPTKSDSVEIIANGCGSPSGLPCRVTHNGRSHTVCVSFQTPRSLQCSQIYIHATLSSCFGSSLQSCPGSLDEKKCSLARRRRSAQQEEVFGPFYIISGARGIPRLELYPDSDITIATNKSTTVVPQFKNVLSLDTERNKDKEVLAPVSRINFNILVIGCALVACILIFLLVVACMRRYDYLL